MMIGCSERFFFVSLDGRPGEGVRPTHLLGMAHLCIGVYCRIIFAVEELSFEPIWRFSLIRSREKKLREVENSLPISRPLFGRFAIALLADDVCCWAVCQSQLRL